jgi:hypothetical protein
MPQGTLERIAAIDASRVVPATANRWAPLLRALQCDRENGSPLWTTQPATSHMNGRACRFGKFGTGGDETIVQGISHMADTADPTAARIERLEELVSHLRHDIRGAISSTSLIAEALLTNGDPVIRRSGQRVATTVERITAILNARLEAVPPKGR